jgi:preprotein translocase subunit SecE
MNKYINNTTQKDIVRDIKIIFASIVIMSFFIFFTNPFSMPIYMLLIIPVLSSIIVFYIADALCSYFFEI